MPVQLYKINYRIIVEFKQNTKNVSRAIYRKINHKELKILSILFIQCQQTIGYRTIAWTRSWGVLICFI